MPAVDDARLPTEENFIFWIFSALCLDFSSIPPKYLSQLLGLLERRY